MGWSAGCKLRRSVDGLRRVLAIELLTAARGVELRAPLSPAPATAAVVATLHDARPAASRDDPVAEEAPGEVPADRHPGGRGERS